MDFARGRSRDKDGHGGNDEDSKLGEHGFKGVTKCGSFSLRIEVEDDEFDWGTFRKFACAFIALREALCHVYSVCAAHKCGDEAKKYNRSTNV